MWSMWTELGQSQICSKILLSGISQSFHLLCSSVFPLCLHYVPRLATLSLNILISECSIRVFHDFSIREYQSSTMHLSALLQFPLTALLGSIDLFSWNYKIFSMV